MPSSSPVKDRPATGRRALRRILLAGTTLLVTVMAWGALLGALRQLPRADTIGRQVETAVQIVFGVLSVLVVATYTRWWKWWPRQTRIAWVISFALFAGLSSLVWGKPMPLVALLFAAGATGVAMAILRALHTSLEDRHEP